MICTETTRKFREYPIRVDLRSQERIFIRTRPCRYSRHDQPRRCSCHTGLDSDQTTGNYEATRGGWEGTSFR